ncbi:sushi, von Willebrand factor type a, egf and pentraxin domain-containing protein 1 [Plakobranchus ocellatus]|uniref:Sushi, von Willebrand factor type a, egf and pentraxin domain-containing protein 1 n=1 Tax=Plakobranchus ocellatus TaxID=259542 RepID=A0AAV4AJT7_9GAST|nr:sushi, von Willebrand factor type a, egf and pentraxin domain-containing protein 1 [Plakobranchus ocellatus]
MLNAKKAIFTTNAEYIEISRQLWADSVRKRVWYQGIWIYTEIREGKNYYWAQEKISNTLWADNFPFLADLRPRSWPIIMVEDSEQGFYKLKLYYAARSYSGLCMQDTFLTTTSSLPTTTTNTYFVTEQSTETTENLSMETVSESPTTCETSPKEKISFGTRRPSEPARNVRRDTASPPSESVYAKIDQSSNVGISTTLKSIVTVNTDTGLRLCKCRCLVNFNATDMKRTTLERREEIKQKLIIRKGNLSASVRKKTSARDMRTSSVSLGSFGIAMLVTVLALLTFPDVVGVASYLYKKCFQKIEK